MSEPMLLPMPGNEAMAAALAQRIGAATGQIELRSFPDGETYLRYAQDVAGRQLVIVCTLDHPDTKFLPLLFAAKTARELGVVRITLVAPYLAYMRQDRRFQPGEAVTSRCVAELLSGAFDALVTVDPHLHRYHSLSDVYTIPSQVVQAAPLISGWIKSHLQNAVLIGPDSESEQWVSAVARGAGAPFTVLEKIRHGDRDVEIRVKDRSLLTRRVPVFVDDIVSSGRTMLEAIRQLRGSTEFLPVCLSVHGLFADRSDELLVQAGARVVTTNTVPHKTNAIDISEPLAQRLSESCASE
jgi:ribose-phosphate pyrophosphokinase